MVLFVFQYFVLGIPSELKGVFLKYEMVSLRFREIIKSTECFAEKKYALLLSREFFTTLRSIVFSNKPSHVRAAAARLR